MPRSTVTLDVALGQVLVETARGREKRAAAPAAPAGDPAAVGLRKVAAVLRTLPDPGVTYEDLNRVKEALYGRR